MDTNINTGYLPEPPQEQDHVLGGVTVGGLPVLGKPSPQVIFPDSHGWLDTIGAERGESQANDNFDTFMCTIYGVGGALSDYLKKAYNFDLDFSACIQGVMAGIQPYVGGTIRNSLESFRTQGWAEECYRKFTESTTLDQCFLVVTDAIRKICKEKLNDWDIYWDLIDSSSDVDHGKIIDALKYSEVVVAGFAWQASYGSQGVFSTNNNRANHCFRIGDGEKNGNFPQAIKDKFKGRDWDVDWSLVDLIAIDSYRYNWRKDPENDHESLNDFLKPLAKDYRIESAYRIYAIPKGEKKNLILNLLIKYMENFYYYWDGKHNFYYVGVPFGETEKYRQSISWSSMSTETKFLFLALRKNFNQSSWAEVSKYKDITSIGKKFA